MKKHYRKETDCANCGAQLQGKFCHACGQENLELKESFGHMMNHAISDYFHFDHQFFHTLKPLFFQPGKLTVEYMAGRRMQYLHPVKMYIFISLVFFVLFFKTTGAEKMDVDSGNSAKHKKELSNTHRKLDSLSKDSKLSEADKGMLKLAQKQNDDQLKAAGVKDTDATLGVKTVKNKRRHFTLWGDDNDPSRLRDTSYQMYLASQAKLPPGKQDNFFTRYTRKREYELSASNKSLKEIFLDGIEHAAPKMMFLLLPLFALLLKITFWKNRKFYVEHLIYSFHFHCFLFLFFSIIMLLKLAIPNAWGINDYINFIATVVIIWYSFKSLRVVYHRSTGRTITKMIGLFFSYTFVFAVCMTLMIMGIALFD